MSETVIILESLQHTVSVPQAQGAAVWTGFLFYLPGDDHLSQQIFLAFEEHIFEVHLPAVSESSIAHQQYTLRQLTWRNRMSLHRLWHTLHQSEPEAAVDGYAMHESPQRTPKRRPQLLDYHCFLLEVTGHLNYLIIIAAARTYHANLGKIIINIRIQYAKHTQEFPRSIILSISSSPNQHRLCHTLSFWPLSYFVILWRYSTTFSWAIVANPLSVSIEIAKIGLEIRKAIWCVERFLYCIFKALWICKPSTPVSPNQSTGL